MGKILENGSSKTSLPDDKKEELLNLQLPIHLDQKAKFIEQLRGHNIAIYDDQIIAIDKSLRQLYNTLKSLIPTGERCEIEYIEEGATVYGFNF
ncbi:MAG: hypothetical protein R6U96_02400 [Promethearchaeia archaeon]